MTTRDGGGCRPEGSDDWSIRLEEFLEFLSDSIGMTVSFAEETGRIEWRGLLWTFSLWENPHAAFLTMLSAIMKRQDLHADKTDAIVLDFIASGPRFLDFHPWRSRTGQWIDERSG